MTADFPWLRRRLEGRDLWLIRPAGPDQLELIHAFDATELDRARRHFGRVIARVPAAGVPRAPGRARLAATIDRSETLRVPSGRYAVCEQRRLDGEVSLDLRESERGLELRFTVLRPGPGISLDELAAEGPLL